MLASVVILGMWAWWWPGYRSWGAMAVGLLVVLTLWLVWRTVRGDRTVPGHPVHAVLLLPAAVLAFHVVAAAPGQPPVHVKLLAGGLNVSMVFQLALLAGGVLLTQSLLPRAARHVVVLGLCGAAMMCGPAAAMLFARTRPVRTALALVGFGGIGVWLSMLWGLRRRPATEAQPPGPAPGRARAACVAVAALAAIGLTAIAPLQGLLMAGVLAGTLLLAGIVFRRRRIVLLCAGGLLAIGVAAALAGVRWIRAALVELIRHAGQAYGLGEGEEAFRQVSAANSGLVVMAAAVGWVVAACFVAGLAFCVAWLLLHARRRRWGDQGRAIVWSAAAGALACALLAPGGLFIPSVTLAVAFVWGLLPAMLGRQDRPRPGWMLLAGVLLPVVLLGVARGDGLLSWISAALRAHDALLHGAAGFLTAMLLAWLLAGRWWLGLVGIALAALAGGAGEVVQFLAASGTVEFRDWLNHALGSAIAVGPYLLCLGARWCESPDAAPRRPPEVGAGLGPAAARHRA